MIPKCGWDQGREWDSIRWLGDRLVDFEFIEEEIILGGPDLIRRAFKEGSEVRGGRSQRYSPAGLEEHKQASCALPTGHGATGQGAAGPTTRTHLEGGSQTAPADPSV